MIVEKKASSSDHGVLGGRTARACENCLYKRASWFCVSDDAFLCHGCDALVHSANQLASRHERILLQASLMEVETSMGTIQSSRRAITPTVKKNLSSQKQGKEREIGEISHPLVPEIENEEALVDENEEHLLHRVPVFDFCNILNDEDEYEQKLFVSEEFDDFNVSFLPSELELADFVADVESLLEIRNVKEEEEEEMEVLGEDEVMEEKVLTMAKGGNEDVGIERKPFLRLNYEEILSAWNVKSSPWTTGHRPEISLDFSPDHFLGLRPRDNVDRMSRKIGFWGKGEREARVTRYREKRRRRLFGKKIRYQVRKLNAEKRPRMRGRFVKKKE